MILKEALQEHLSTSLRNRNKKKNTKKVDVQKKNNNLRKKMGTTEGPISKMKHKKWRGGREDEEDLERRE